MAGLEDYLKNIPDKERKLSAFVESREHIACIAKDIVHWETAANFFEITKQEQAAIERKSRVYEEQKVEFLDKWIEKDRINGTYHNLAACLYKAGLTSALLTLSQLLGAPKNPSETESSRWITSTTVDPIGEREVEASKHSRGIAIIVTCDYKGTQSSLSGTEKDAKEMEKTAVKLNFHPVSLHNPTKDQIEMKVRSISSALPLLEDVSNFKAIMFVFSGHGKYPDMITSQDLKDLRLIEDIVEPLIGHQQIKDIPKLFFIDACRGKERLKQEHSKGDIEEEANYRIDYSTLPRHVAFMTQDGGQSEWLPTLAKKLRTKNDSVQNIVADVNKEVFNRTQQQGEMRTQQGEIKVDRLRCGALYLHPMADDVSRPCCCTS